MNIFVLASDPEECARYHCDKHIVKMPTEYAQILSTVHHRFDTEWVDHVYRQTHQNTPCPLWVGESWRNYLWLYDLFREVCDEYTHRYGRVHLADRKMREVLTNVPGELPDTDDLTPHPLVMPPQYWTDCAVESYRNFYRGDKIVFARWTKREVPGWMNEG